MKAIPRLCSSIAFLLLLSIALVAATPNHPGGFTVVMGADSADELIELQAKGRLLVHGLSTDAGVVESVRRELEQSGNIGSVNISQYDGETLPFIENTVNSVVVHSAGTVSEAEMMRVLVPNGVVVHSESGSTVRKPWPEDVDSWPQYLHDPGNNAVASDDKVGPPRHLQWRAGPRWSRHHDHMSSVSAVVTSEGRVFSIMDEGSVSSILLPSNWQLTARDAFNGLQLWSRPIDEWYTRVFGLKSGPSTLPRRLATDGEKVFVTLGIDAPVSVLDAASGKTLFDLETEGYPREILLVEDMVLVVTRSEPIDNTSSPYSDQGDAAIFAFNKDTGKALWNVETPVVRLTLGADTERVYFFDQKEVVALDRSNGKKKWGCPKLGYRHIISEDAPILVVYGDTVLFADPKNASFLSKDGKSGTNQRRPQNASLALRPRGQNFKPKLMAMDAETGKLLWEGEQPISGYRSPGDVLVVDGQVWNGPTKQGNFTGTQTARNLRTGESERELPPTVETYWFHHRCYRARATDNYLMLSRTGIEYIDLETGEWDINHYMRGACLYGVMPANGLTYAPPHPCSCYPETKLDGFTAVSASNDYGAVVPDPGKDADSRLESGPAFGIQTVDDACGDDWPTYRYAINRSGYSKNEPGSSLDTNWTTDLGTQATQPIIVGDRVFVSTPETNSIHALDAASGKVQWTFTSGGKSDTPPTWYKGRLLFGSTDGYVYCLNAEDGKLAWRFRAAPLDRRMVHFERVESVWPVNGNILVLDGEAVFVAGRSVFLDGGLRFIRLDALSGELLHESILDRIDDRTGEDLHGGVERLNMPVGLPDLLGSDGTRLFMRSEVLDKQGKRLGQAPHSTEPIEVILQRPEADAHLYAPSGFAEDNWWHRTYWNYGSVFTGGHDGFYQAGRFTPSGRILVHDGDNVYGYGRKQNFLRWISTIEYQLFSAPRDQTRGPEQMESALKSKKKNMMDQSYHVKMNWTGDISLQLRAMAGAGSKLIMAGPPDVLDESGLQKPQLFEFIKQEEARKKIKAQQSSEDGEMGCFLVVVDPTNGDMLAKRHLESAPVFDGLSVAHNRVYMSTIDGKISCFGK